MNPYPVVRESGTRSMFHVQPLAPVDTHMPPGTYQPLIERLATLRHDLGAGVIVGFSSISRGEGVTYVIESLAWELARQTGEQTLLTTPDGLISAASARFGDAPTGSHALYPVRRLRSADAVARPWDTAPRHEFEGLRRRFGFVLVDCPAIRTQRASAPVTRGQHALSRHGGAPQNDPGASVLVVCRSCDGVVLVVSAGSTKRREIQYAQSALQVASANLLGLVLNRRVDCVPGFLSRLVE